MKNLKNSGENLRFLSHPDPSKNGGHAEFPKKLL